MFNEAPYEICPSLPTGDVYTCMPTVCMLRVMRRGQMSKFFLSALYMTSPYCTLCLYSYMCVRRFCACVLASVLIGLSDEMLLRAVVIARCPNWQHSLSTFSPKREFDLSGVTTMCFLAAQSVI